jgi:hypothetical protein
VLARGAAQDRTLRVASSQQGGDLVCVVSCNLSLSLFCSSTHIARTSPTIFYPVAKHRFHRGESHLTASGTEHCPALPRHFCRCDYRTDNLRVTTFTPTLYSSLSPFSKYTPQWIPTSNMYVVQLPARRAPMRLPCGLRTFYATALDTFTWSTVGQHTNDNAGRTAAVPSVAATDPPRRWPVQPKRAAVSTGSTQQQRLLWLAQPIPARPWLRATSGTIWASRRTLWTAPAADELPAGPAAAWRLLPGRQEAGRWRRRRLVRWSLRRSSMLLLPGLLVLSMGCFVNVWRWIVCPFEGDKGARRGYCLVFCACWTG